MCSRVFTAVLCLEELFWTVVAVAFSAYFLPSTMTLGCLGYALSTVLCCLVVITEDGRVTAV